MSQSKKKVLHLIQSLGNGGCENALLRLLPLMDQFEHRIITLKEKGELAHKFEAAGIAVKNIGQSGLFDPGAYARIKKEAKSYRPDLVLTYLFHADLIGRLYLQTFTRVPVIPFLRSTYNHPHFWPARLFEQTTKYLAKDYLANAESVKKFYVERFNIRSNKITVIPNGIETAFFDKVTRDESLAREIGLSKNDTGIACVANLHPNKGHRFLLEAFRQLSPQHQNLKLLIVGDGLERVNLEDQAKSYALEDRVKFLGRRSDVPEILELSQIFAFPTLFEGMSNSLLEAMASGLAIVASDIPENKELISNGHNGLLFRTGQSRDLAAKIDKILTDDNLRKSLANQARADVQEKYDLQKVTKRLSEYIRTKIKS